MKLAIVGPGRAGGSLGIAALAAGHSISAVVPGPSGAAPAALVPFVLPPGETLPEVDVLLLAVRDDEIRPAAEQLLLRTAGAGVVAHLSGFVSVDALAPLASRVLALGSLHPLQTLPSPERGAPALAGAWAAVTGPPPAAGPLAALARSLGMHPFPLDDGDKAAYHAGAAAASNFLVTALALAEPLFARSSVPMAAARPLAEAVVQNVFELGAQGALTGPIARGDIGTLAGHLQAADDAGIGGAFRRLAAATAILAGTEAQVGPVLHPGGGV